LVLFFVWLVFDVGGARGREEGFVCGGLFLVCFVFFCVGLFLLVGCFLVAVCGGGGFLCCCWLWVLFVFGWFWGGFGWGLWWGFVFVWLVLEWGVGREVFVFLCYCFYWWCPGGGGVVGWGCGLGGVWGGGVFVVVGRFDFCLGLFIGGVFLGLGCGFVLGWFVW